MTASWIDQASTVAERLCKVKAARNIVLETEENFPTDSPFEGISKLQWIVSKARSPERITWAVGSIADHWAYGQRIKGEGLHLRTLTGGDAMAPCHMPSPTSRGTAKSIC